MASVHHTAVRPAVQTPPVVSVLQAVFAQLDDSPLLNALRGPVRRGPKGHPHRVLWQSFVAKYVLGLESTAALIRTLINNPFIAGACGIHSPEAVPHEATYSRFFAKLSTRKFQHLVKDVSRSLVRHHYAMLPGFGKRVAMDSTTLKGWANGGKPKKSDPEAGWSIKRGTQGTHKEFTYGWKLHLLVDCEYELPIAANVTPGNIHDASKASALLSEARFHTKRFRPDYVMADAGYSGKDLFELIKRQ